MSIESDSLVATKKFHKELGKLIEPLEPYFGIKQFCYHALFADGTSVHINTDLGVTEYFANTGLYSVSSHQVCPDNIGTGIVSWKSSDDDDYRNAIDIMESNFNIAHGVSYIEKSENYCQVFGFSAPESSKKTQKKVQNDAKYLLKFIDYLKVEAAPIFNQAIEECRFDLAAIKDNYYTQQGIIPNEVDDRKNLVNLLVEIGLVDPKLSNVVLTPQEKKCVSLCIQGKSAKQVGHELDLSYRTVESYLETIKEKLGIYYKRELFDLKDSLVELGMLD